MPKLIPIETYNSFEYYKSIIFMFPFVLFGSYSGFIYSKYTEGADQFPALIILGVSTSTVFSVILSIYYSNALLILPFIIINIFTIVEQKLKVNKQFVLGFSFKPILSIVIILLGLIIYNFETELLFDQLLTLSFVIAITTWIVLVSRSLKLNDFALIDKNYFRQYKNLIQKGFPIAFSSIVLALIFFSDRYMIAHYYEDYLTTYTFGANLSQMLVLALTTLAYVSAIDIGENKKKLTKKKLGVIFKKSLLGYIMLLVLLVPGTMFLNLFYNFEDLVLITFIISYSKGFYFLLTIISSVVLYFNFQLEALIAIIIVAIINFLLLLWIVNIGCSVYTMLITSSLSLFVYSLYTLYIIFVKIQYDAIVEA